MQPDIVPKKNKRRSLSLHLGLFLLAIYLLTYRGGFHSVDEVSIFAVTENLVKFGRVNTDQIAWTQWTTSQAEAQGFFGRDGHVYSKKGLALSLAQAPLYWLALWLPNIGMLQTVSLLNAFITTATGLLICMFTQRLGFSNLTALLVSLTFGLATIAFVYAKYLFSEPLAGFLLLLAAYMLFVYRQEGGLHHVAIAGLAAGFAVLTRANNLFLLPVFGLYLLWILYEEARRQGREETRRPGREDARTRGREETASFASSPHRLTASPLAPLAVFALTVAFAGAILMAYNALRSGNPLQTGYDLTLFSPNILLGLYKLLFSPLRGFFIYSPILFLSLPGWWWLRKTHPAEAWLFAGLAGMTISLFSAWSSGEGLSWGSRFLVPVVPFFAVCLAPIIEQAATSRGAGEQGSRGENIHTADKTEYAPRTTHHVLHFTFYVLLPLSLLIQFLGVVINPWVFLSQVQTEFGGEFFLENTAALYDFGYSQIAGQFQTWSLQNSDLAWWQPWGFDGFAFGLSLGLVLLSGWLLWREMKQERKGAGAQGRKEILSSLPLRSPAPLLVILTFVLTYFLLTRYYTTDRQFGPPDDPYSQALNRAAAQAAPGDQFVTVAQYHYHVPMNRFKTRLPITGLAQQPWPPPDTALPLLQNTLAGQNVWLITVGIPPAASDNATEQWLTRHAFAAGNDWFDDVRLVRFGTQPPGITRSINTTLGDEVQLVEVELTEALQPGQLLPVEFTWQPLRQPQTDYNLFLQLLGPDGALAAQHDSPPNGGYTPISGWSMDQTIITRHALPLPPDLPTGTYRLIAGLYNPASGRRLTVGQSDFVELGQITLNVERSPQ
ncbi:MAG: phospholipid carrier-dependent glycosyltransferase [Anaerolineae bacterium]|nr:phospholipid carrier-dependent glycosyltransferase [Anaerolineae bacterium]